MSKIKVLLWDLDDTLIDFKKAEKAALKSLFLDFGLGECTASMIEEYSAINESYWQKLERKELSKSEILIKRFCDFFRLHGIDENLAESFNEAYQLRLGDTIVYRDDALEILKKIKGKLIQCITTNGTLVAQTKKLERSHIGELVDHIYISQVVGYEKPDTRFFAKVFEDLDASKDEIMIIGDSPSSDMRGGIDSGIITCFYDPNDKGTDLAIDHHIKDLHEVLDIIDI